MEKLAIIYPTAVERTKQKVQDDIISYMQGKETMPSFDDYMRERKHYIEQIWANIWTNHATNKVTRVEKKRLLGAKGIQVDDVDRKMINQLFRSEMKTYQPFLVEKWLHEKYTMEKEQWAKLYNKARAEYLKREKEREIANESKQMVEMIDNKVEELVRNRRHLFYLQTRKFVADRMKADFQVKTSYLHQDPSAIEKRLIENGPLEPSSYSTVKEFFSELTGNIQKKFEWGQYDYEFETYDDVYQSSIYEFLCDIVPEVIKESVLTDLITGYEEGFVASVINEKLHELLIDLSLDFRAYLADEWLMDVLKLAEIPFEEKQHEKIFIEDVKSREIKKAQERAEIERKKEEEIRILNEIFEREYNPPSSRNVHYILHIGETNTGKTYQALQRMMAAESGMYLAPLRLLALEVSDLLNAQGTLCSLKTGEEEKILPSAHHISCTVEMFHEKDFYDVVVIDEAQMIADKNRGFSWYKAITKVQAREIHIIASKNARDMLVELLGDSKIEVIEYKRDTPLEVEQKEFKIKHVNKGDALICFSRRRVLETASKLQNDGHSVSMIYGSMPPETRKKQVERFSKGDSDIIVSTDAIGMGLNLPIRRIVFLENMKFDGTSRRRLTSQEVKQIAGRAGRKGLYDKGKVAFTEDINSMKKLLIHEDESIQTFTIAPTGAVFERFQKYYHDLGTFFELWHKFKSPPGTKKASLAVEEELYQLIRGTELEARLSMMDQYSLLHLPFSTRESELIRQWKRTAEAIVAGNELPEPKIKKRTLEDLELSYKTIGLHLLFLYRLNKPTDAIYWERLREEISLLVHEKLKTEVKEMQKKCRKCNKKLPWDHRYQICDSCYSQRYRHYDYF